MGRSIWRMGTLLAKVRDRALWQVAYPSFDAWLLDGVDVSRATAYRVMKAVTQFSEAVAERYGADKVDALIRYLDVTPAEERPGDVYALDLRLRGEGGRFTTVTVEDATVAQVQEATRLLREAKRGGRRIPAELTAQADALSRELPGTGKGRVKLARDKAGRLTVTFRAIPLDDLEAFLNIVRTRMPPPE
jgi:hypothetical protein